MFSAYKNIFTTKIKRITVNILAYFATFEVQIIYPEKNFPKLFVSYINMYDRIAAKFRGTQFSQIAI